MLHQTAKIFKNKLNKFYNAIDVVFILSGKPGDQGKRGPAGPQGPIGIQGEPGEVGVSYIRWGKKTCPNTGATLVYEGNNKTVCIFQHMALAQLRLSLKV